MQPLFGLITQKSYGIEKNNLHRDTTSYIDYTKDAIERTINFLKSLFSQSIRYLWWGGMHPPSPPP